MPNHSQALLAKDLGVSTVKSCQPSLSHHMRRYREYLEYKYESLELTSIDEKLNCSALEYINLTLVKIDEQERNLSEEDKRGDTVTLSEALNVEGEKKKVILIKGDPGMGKTTLAINICKRWAEGSLLQSYDAVILLPLRNLGIQRANTVGDLLLTLDTEIREAVLKEIARNLGEKICFILEGYDELPEILYTTSVFTELREKLPKCTLIYTSRPEACDKVASPSRVIKIEGFKEESVNEYISKTFEHVKDGQDLASKLKSQIHTNAIVEGLLHVPINVAIVCMIFFHCLMLPETYTQLYTLLCIRLILRHITTRTTSVTKVEELHSLDDLPKDIAEQFSQLCFIAYKGVENDKLIYSSHELQSFDVVINKTNNLGLLVTAPSTSLYGTEKSYNFLHKTVQEFCAAWYISKILSPQDRLKHINTNWDNDRYYMVLIFYSGITGLKNTELLNCILPSRLFTLATMYVSKVWLY
ncbi:protein NLRC5-like isoform X2 [Dysidea avara]|uniref:protein NLRC5-like isoform X2 n=1 Tax=Dysidea avara TaxID=196820 RepID=UPI00332452A5